MKSSSAKKTTPLLLLILDGLGLPKKNDPHTIVSEKTMPFLLGTLWKRAPHATLKAHGTDAGLLAGQAGNSEAGHMNIGAGRIVKQDIRHIHDAISDGTFFKNTAILEALKHAKKYKTKVHVMGMLSNGNSGHASPEHLYALLHLLREQKMHGVFLHLFTDGRDSRPHESAALLKRLEQHFHNNEKIATIMGRFYAMDRNKRWERTARAYAAMVEGKASCTAHSPYDAINQAYNREETDEFMCPTVITRKKKPIATVDDNDVIIFFNLRSDRARQLTKPFAQGLFEAANPGVFRRKKRPENIRFVAMTDFGPDLPGIFTAFPSRDTYETLPFIWTRTGMRQLYIAESEKYAHVTYFFNGGFARPVYNEAWVRVPSPYVDHYEMRPDMSIKKIIQHIKKSIKKKTHDCIVANIANADMMAHTGNIHAAEKALSTIDRSIRSIVTTYGKNAHICITADHGNVEHMRDKKTNEIITEHTTNPVPFFLLAAHKKQVRLRPHGRLADIAPTLLNLYNIKKPKEMNGKSLLL